MKIQNLNAKEFKGVALRVQQARQRLINIQAHMRDPMIANSLALDEKECKAEFGKWLSIEENIMMQKSRVQWLKLGDANTSYVHACLKSRQG